MILPADDLKKEGIEVVDDIIKEEGEAIISVKGKHKYVILDIERYEKLREKELELAYLESIEDLQKNKYHTDIEKHLKIFEN